MEIVIDFDGTVVTHDFPNVGKDIGAVPVLKEIVAKGHKLILFTMRSDNIDQEVKATSAEIIGIKGLFLSDAVNWFKENDIPLWGIQTNPDQFKWTQSPKAYGQIIIDDAALGAPIICNTELSNRPFVCWVKARKLLRDIGVL